MISPAPQSDGRPPLAPEVLLKQLSAAHIFEDSYARSMPKRRPVTCLRSPTVSRTLAAISLWAIALQSHQLQACFLGYAFQLRAIRSRGLFDREIPPSRRKWPGKPRRNTSGWTMMRRVRIQSATWRAGKYNSHRRERSLFADHDYVLRDIDVLIGEGVLGFQYTPYIHPTERPILSLLRHEPRRFCTPGCFTGPKALLFESWTVALRRRC